MCDNNWFYWVPSKRETNTYCLQYRFSLSTYLVRFLHVLGNLAVCSRECTGELRPAKLSPDHDTVEQAITYYGMMAQGGPSILKYYQVREWELVTLEASDGHAKGRPWLGFLGSSVGDLEGDEFPIVGLAVRQLARPSLEHIPVLNHDQFNGVVMINA